MHTRAHACTRVWARASVARSLAFARARTDAESMYARNAKYAVASWFATRRSRAHYNAADGKKSRVQQCAWVQRRARARARGRRDRFRDDIAAVSDRFRCVVFSEGRALLRKRSRRVSRVRPRRVQPPCNPPVQTITAIFESLHVGTIALSERKSNSFRISIVSLCVLRVLQRCASSSNFSTATRYILYSAFRTQSFFYYEKRSFRSWNGSLRNCCF